MKKLLVIMIVTMVTAIAAVAFAVSPTAITNTAPATIGGATFTPSQNVIISANSTTNSYVCTSAHSSAASGPGYEYQIQSSYNGIQKKAWLNQTTTATWPDPSSSPTTSVAGFN